MVSTTVAPGSVCEKLWDLELCAVTLTIILNFEHLLSMHGPMQALQNPKGLEDLTGLTELQQSSQAVRTGALPRTVQYSKGTLCRVQAHTGQYPNPPACLCR